MNVGEHHARLTIASFVVPGPLRTGRVTLDEHAAHHARVRRLGDGDSVTLRNGAGTVAQGRVARLAKHALDVDIDSLDHVAPPPPVHLLAPVGDRDRMLWLAEKAVEIGVASWRAVRWQRSRSVAARGEGEAFVAKLRARMAQALAQSEGAWLPTVQDAADVSLMLNELPAGDRLLLDGSGAAFAPAEPTNPGSICLAVGPEGGLEPDEVARCEAAGFRRVRLPGNVLRFETAGVIGLAFARAVVDQNRLDPTLPPALAANV